jgi:hypothetical protein
MRYQEDLKLSFFPRRVPSMKSRLIVLCCALLLSACAPALPDETGMQATVQVAIAQTETSVARSQSASLNATLEPGAVQPQTPWPTQPIEPTATQQAFNISIPDMLATLAKASTMRRFTVPDDGYVYMQVKHDFETGFWENKPRAFSINGWDSEANPQGGFPDTFPCETVGGTRERVRLTEPFQVLWFDLLRLASKNTIPNDILKERWAEITEHGRALTDFFAVQQGYRDYVLGKNLNAKDIQQKTLTMGGNIVRIIGSNETHWYIEAIDASQPAPEAKDIINKPWLVHWGTQSTIEKLEDGGYLVTDWGQLNYGDDHYGVPFMLISPDGRLQIRKEFLKPIENGAEYSPYSPPKD